MARPSARATDAFGPPVVGRGWDVSERRLVLLLADLAIVIGGLLIAQRGAEPAALDLATSLPPVLALAAIWVVVGRALGAYDLVTAARPPEALPRLAVVAGLAMQIYWLLPAWSIPPGTVQQAVLHLGLLLVPLLGWRAAYALAITRPAHRIPTLLLGDGQPIAAVAEILSGESWHAYHLAASVRRDSPQLAPPSAEGLIRLVREQSIRQLVVDPLVCRSAAVQLALIELAERRVTITMATEMYESLTGRVALPLDEPVIWSRPGVTMSLYTAVRRLIDLVVAASGLLLFSPLLVLAALAIWLDSPGSPLYWQERIGRWGKPFRIVKLRTMVRHAEHEGKAVWAQQGDPRVTRIGALLRRSRFDEIPQLWNVLRGEMSLIGPRPERPEFVALLTREFPLYGARHAIQPGISGWAQVKYKYGSSIPDALAKLQYDLYYVRHRSIFLDAIVVLETLCVVLRLRGQ